MPVSPVHEEMTRSGHGHHGRHPTPNPWAGRHPDPAGVDDRHGNQRDRGDGIDGGLELQNGEPLPGLFGQREIGGEQQGRHQCHPVAPQAPSGHRRRPVQHQGRPRQGGGHQPDQPQRDRFGEPAPGHSQQDHREQGPDQAGVGDGGGQQGQVEEDDPARQGQPGRPAPPDAGPTRPLAGNGQRDGVHTGAEKHPPEGELRPGQIGLADHEVPGPPAHRRSDRHGQPGPMEAFGPIGARSGHVPSLPAAEAQPRPGGTRTHRRQAILPVG